MRRWDFAHVRVLVVDDHDHMRSIVTTLLRAFGVNQVVEAANGEAAWQAFPEFGPDLVILDLCMPELDGLAFARRLRRAGGKYFQTPILMITGHAELGLVLAARDAGVDEVLVKPITARDVLARISRIIDSEWPYVISDDYVGPCRRRRPPVDHDGPWRRAEDQPRAVEI